MSSIHVLQLQLSPPCPDPEQHSLSRSSCILPVAKGQPEGHGLLCIPGNSTAISSTRQCYQQKCPLMLLTIWLRGFAKLLFWNRASLLPARLTSRLPVPAKGHDWHLIWASDLGRESQWAWRINISSLLHLFTTLDFGSQIPSSSSVSGLFPWGQ